MAPLKNHLEVFQFLPKTNCKECGLPACLAFAVAVVKGQKKLTDCPYADRDQIAGLEVASAGRPQRETDYQEALGQLQAQIPAVDFKAMAPLLGAELKGDSLRIKSLGKDFLVSPQGVVTSQCHTNVWICLALLNYILSCTGREPKQDWVPLRDLAGGADWGPLFGQRCEKPFKKVVDGYTGLMEDIIDIFSGQPAPGSFESDIAVIIHPLPRLPLLLCYWKSEEGMDSQFNLFFDRSAPHNLKIESIYGLGVGLLTMFERISQTHGV